MNTPSCRAASARNITDEHTSGLDSRSSHSITPGVVMAGCMVGASTPSSSVRVAVPSSTVPGCAPKNAACRASRVGRLRSSWSSMAISAPRARPSARLRDPTTFRLRSLRTTRSRGSPIPRRISGVASVEQSSTTITSRSPSVCDRMLSRLARIVRAPLCVAMMTLTAGTPVTATPWSPPSVRSGTAHAARPAVVLGWRPSRTPGRGRPAPPRRPGSASPGTAASALPRSAPASGAG